MTAAATGAVMIGPMIARRPRRIALAGNPNVGKSSLFNLLTGLRQKVTNYPGTTVEKLIGKMSASGSTLDVVDLPGAYSLLAQSPDEAVARDEVLGRMHGEPPPDVIVIAVDASNLERNLFLATQILDTGKPCVIALNQVDLAVSAGVTIDAAELSRRLGVAVIPTNARTGQGRDALVEAILAGGRKAPRLVVTLPPAILDAASALAPDFAQRFGTLARAAEALPRYLASEGEAAEFIDLLTREGGNDALIASFRIARADLAAKGVDPAVASAEARYAAIERIAAAAVRRASHAPGWRSRLDRVLLHPVSGTLVLLAVFTFLFLVVFQFSKPLIDAVDQSLASVGAWAGGLVLSGTGAELLANFVEKGLVAGFGAFLVFVPQIALLFLCIEAFEDSGYLARAAFLMDRVMGKAGLPGRAFLPLLSGFACAIPGMMATRTMSNARDRLVTMAVMPLMSCSARLPVYGVVVGAVFAGAAFWVGPLVMISMYVLGILVAVAASSVLRRTVLKGGRTPLLLELPPYRIPAIATVVRNTTRRTWSFVSGAGPIILVFTVVIWGLLTFPRVEVASGTARDVAHSMQLEGSYLGRAGKTIEPALKPLGFDWKIGIGILGSFAAREVFVPTLGVVYAVGDDADEEDEGLLQAIRDDKWPDGRPIFTPLAGISLLVFYVLALQCMSTLATLKRETGSWRWPFWLFTALLVVAYVASLVTYQAGTALGF